MHCLVMDSRYRQVNHSHPSSPHPAPRDHRDYNLDFTAPGSGTKPSEAANLLHVAMNSGLTVQPHTCTVTIQLFYPGHNDQTDSRLCATQSHFSFQQRASHIASICAQLHFVLSFQLMRCHITVLFNHMALHQLISKLDDLSVLCDNQVDVQAMPLSCLSA